MTSLGSRFARLLSDTTNPRSFSRLLRRRRLAAHLLPLLEEIAATRGSVRILDIGGTRRYWDLLPPGTLDRLKIAVTLVNLPGHLPDNLPPPFTALTGDGCDLSALPDHSYDLVHSNSVIEHVGDWSRMQAFAREARRLAPAHYIQTPDWAFPVEPHCMTPLFHWLPLGWRCRLVRRFALGHWPRATSPQQALEIVQSARLLTRTRMQQLFPASTIRRERLFGLPKSLIAVQIHPDRLDIG